MSLVAVCSPHGGKVSAEWTRRLFELEAKHPEHQFVNVEIELIIVGKARAMCVETAVNIGNIDVVLFVDDDVLLPDNAIDLIDQALQLGVVSGLYFARQAPYLPQLYRTATEPEYEGMFWPIVEYEEGLIKVDAVGCGCLAIRMDVFKKIQDAWVPRVKAQADLLTDRALQIVVQRLSPWFEFLDRKGEDMWFCDRCRDIGQVIWANTTVKCEHLTVMPIVEAHFKYAVNAGMIKVEAPK